MVRFLVAAASAALVASVALPALADDYPPCTTRGQDHCKVGVDGWNHREGHMMSHHHHHMKPKPKHHH